MGKRLFPIFFFTSYTSTFPLFSCHSRSHLVEAGRGRRSRNFITSPLIESRRILLAPWVEASVWPVWSEGKENCVKIIAKSWEGVVVCWLRERDMGVGEVYLDEISINFFKLMIIEACLWWIWTLCHSWKEKNLECFPLHWYSPNL